MPLTQRQLHWHQAILCLRFLSDSFIYTSSTKRSSINKSSSRSNMFVAWLTTGSMFCLRGRKELACTHRHPSFVCAFCWIPSPVGSFPIFHFAFGNGVQLAEVGAHGDVYTSEGALCAVCSLLVRAPYSGSSVYHAFQSSHSLHGPCMIEMRRHGVTNMCPLCRQPRWSVPSLRDERRQRRYAVRRIWPGRRQFAPNAMVDLLCAHFR